MRASLQPAILLPETGCLTAAANPIHLLPTPRRATLGIATVGSFHVDGLEAPPHSLQVVVLRIDCPELRGNTVRGAMVGSAIPELPPQL